MFTGNCSDSMMRSATARAASGIRHVAQDHRELVAAETRDGVAILHAGAQALRDDGEQLVAGSVADRVVHALEVIEVDVEQRAATRAPPSRSPAPAPDDRGTAAGSATPSADRSAPADAAARRAPSSTARSRDARANCPPQLGDLRIACRAPRDSRRRGSPRRARPRITGQTQKNSRADLVQRPQEAVARLFAARDREPASRRRACPSCRHRARRGSPADPLRPFAAR